MVLIFCDCSWNSGGVLHNEITQWDAQTVFVTGERMKRKKKTKKRLSHSMRTEVSKEMTKPRLSKSAKIQQLNFDPTRIPEQPSTIMLGTVEKIIPVRLHAPEKAQIGIDGAATPHRDFQIENTLTDEHGQDVKLKKGARVEVTVTARNPSSKILEK